LYVVYYRTLGDRLENGVDEKIKREMGVIDSWNEWRLLKEIKTTISLFGNLMA
jgi:hypothetical protein